MCVVIAGHKPKLLGNWCAGWSVALKCFLRSWLLMRFVLLDIVRLKSKRWRDFGWFGSIRSVSVEKVERERESGWLIGRFRFLLAKLWNLVMVCEHSSSHFERFNFWNCQLFTAWTLCELGRTFSLHSKFRNSSLNFWVSRNFLVRKVFRNQRRGTRGERSVRRNLNKLLEQ